MQATKSGLKDQLKELLVLEAVYDAEKSLARAHWRKRPERSAVVMLYLADLINDHASVAAHRHVLQDSFFHFVEGSMLRQSSLHFQRKGIGMISQLKPLLSTRALTLTLASVGEDRIRVNVFPMKLNKEESSALSQPLSVEGTAEEPAALVDYVATHLTIKQSLERTKAEMEAAEKAAREETNAKKAKISCKKTTETKVEAKPQEASKPEPPEPPSLFDAEPVTPVPAPVAVPTPGASPSEQDLEEEEILAEVRAEDDADEKEAA